MCESFCEDSFFLTGGFLLRECYGLLGDAFVCVALDWPLLLALEDGLSICGCERGVGVDDDDCGG
jgi:hypothetical protein